MDYRKRCICCDVKAVNNKRSNKLLGNKSYCRNEPRVLLIRIEDNKKLLKFINLRPKFDSQELKCVRVKRNLSKNVTYVIDENHECLTVSNMSLDYVKCDINTPKPEHDSDSSDNKKSMKTLVISPKCLAALQLRVKENVTDKKVSTSIASTLRLDNKTLDNIKNKNSPTSPSKKQNEVEEVILNNVGRKLQTEGKLSTSSQGEIEILKRQSSSKTYMKASSKRNIAPDIAEPLNLISKLTGCQIPPSKVKVLPLPPNCISDSFGGSSCLVSSSIGVDDKNITKHSPPRNNSSVKSFYREVSHPANGNITSTSVRKCYNGQSPTCIASNEIKHGVEDVRTIYDVMEYISAVMPSWNLHIIPDTNTFCICEVTRNKEGIPRISKSIEVDDDFNAKVYIYNRHIKYFDGVYNSEDAFVSLIERVDEVELC